MPPSLALWIPAGLPHATESEGDAVMRSAYVAPACCPHIDWREPTVLAVTPLLRALIDHLVRTDLAADARNRAEAVLLDELHPVPVTSVSVPAPRDARARAVAERLSANPADGRTLAAWGTEVGASARTLARLFVAETGLAFGQWRERLRMQAAMPYLAAGLPIEAVADRIGYATASSFTAAFHRLVGVTPRQYFPVGSWGRSGSFRGGAAGSARSGAAPRAKTMPSAVHGRSGARGGAPDARCRRCPGGLPTRRRHCVAPRSR